MIELLAGLVRRTRQHHGLEHATLTTLAHRLPQRRMLGISDPFGFTLFGDLEQTQVQRAVADALMRLQAGESKLAIHPNCGTNLAATGLLVSLAVALSRLGKRDRFSQFTRTALFITPALVAAQPLGLTLQQYTTLGDLAGRWLVGVRSLRLGPLGIHRVVLD